MDRQAVALVLIVTASGVTATGCALRGGGNDLDGLCKFASHPVATDAEARELSRQIRAAMPKESPNRSRNRAIADAAVAAAVPVSHERH